MQYCGRIKSYNPKQGYGFLDCPEAHACFGRDVFIHKAQMGELLGRFVGPGTKLDPKTLKMNVGFSVEINKSGMPQARDVARLDNVAGQCSLDSNAPVEPVQEEVDLNLLSPASPAAANSAESQSGEAWDDEVARKGYKGRGGTIRIPSNAEVQDGDDSGIPVALPVPPGPRVGGAVRKTAWPGAGAGAGTAGGGAWLQRHGQPESLQGGDGPPIDIQNENWENIDDDPARKGRRSPKSSGSGAASVSSPVESKRRGYKDPYFRQQPQYQTLGAYDSAAAAPYQQANGPAVQYGQVQATQPQSQPVSPMGSPSPYASNAVPTLYGVQDPQSPSGVSYAAPFQVSAALLAYSPQLYSAGMQSFSDPSQPIPQFLQFQQPPQQLYGQQVQQLQPLPQAVPLSPQSTSQYAASSSSPPLTPLPVAAMSDASSGSPVAVPLAPSSSLPGVLLPISGAVPQDMAMLLAVASGIDPNQAMMSTDASAGSPTNLQGRATYHPGRVDDSDSDSGYRPPAQMAEGSPAQLQAAGIRSCSLDDSDSDAGFIPPVPLVEAVPAGVRSAGGIHMVPWPTEVDIRT